MTLTPSYEYSVMSHLLNHPDIGSSGANNIGIVDESFMEDGRLT